MILSSVTLAQMDEELCQMDYSDTVQTNSTLRSLLHQFNSHLYELFLIALGEL